MNILYSVTMQVKLLSQAGKVPVRATPGAAGYDLFAAVDCQITPHGKALVTTDIAISIPAGYYGRIAPRSSLALKHHIDVGAGVIDSDYRGCVSVLLFNHGSTFDVKVGDRIAQLIITKIEHPDIELVDDLSETIRGGGGFGSTGISDML